MPHARMAAEAGDFVDAGLMDRRSQTFVAMQTGSFSDPAVPFGDADHVGKPARGKGPGMEESIQRLGGVLWNKCMRRVAIVADGGVAVTALHPSCILFLHHVAVGAGCGIVGQIRSRFRILKSIGARTDENTAGVVGYPGADAV